MNLALAVSLLCGPGLQAGENDKIDFSKLQSPTDRVTYRWNEFAEATRAWQKAFEKLRPEFTLNVNPEKFTAEESAAHERMMNALAAYNTERLKWARGDKK